MTVAEQMGLALRDSPGAVAGRASVRRVEELAGLLGITHLLERRPRGLSGGERQAARPGPGAVPVSPAIPRLDEPAEGAGRGDPLGRSSLR